ncbi:hypothetical protein [Pseudonocardia lacus]|uniref:hypothetical protein n=1 Tax=Pseudonocardia lacus TaxID=2835865 RepID=UPI001BDCCD8D|nr:hypothetical protein [Pseudonocardia lacus]
MNGLWHDPGGHDPGSGKAAGRRGRSAKVGTALGAGLPLGLAAVRLVVRRRRRAGERDGATGAPAS